jgi:hypothetical protein
VLARVPHRCVTSDCDSAFVPICACLVSVTSRSRAVCLSGSLPLPPPHGTAPQAVVGFQFWRCRPSLLDPSYHVIRGGKLRLHPSCRRRGLHLLSNVLFAAQRKVAHPTTPLLRISIASVLGFAALSAGLRSVWFVRGDASVSPSCLPTEREPCTLTGRDAHEYGVLNAELVDFCRTNNFDLDTRTGFIDVKIRMSDAEVQRVTSEPLRSHPGVRLYTERHPQCATSPQYMAAGWRVDAASATYMARAALQRLLR